MSTNGPQRGTGGARTSLLSIDILRGAAALAVLLFHAQGFWLRNAELGIWSGKAAHLLDAAPFVHVVTYLLFGLGSLGVPLFFVISGFCIHLPHANQDRPLALGSFAVRRFFRLYPPYLAVCAIGLALAIAHTGWGVEPATASNVLGHLVFWHYSWPPQASGTEMTVVIWTIAVEVHFYALYALLLPWLRRFGFTRAAFLWLGLGIAYRVLWLAADPSEDVIRLLEPHRFALARFGEWLLGAALAERYVQGSLTRSFGGRWRTSARGWLARTVAGIAVCAAAVAALGGQSPDLDVPATLLFTLLTGGLIACETAGELRPSEASRLVASWLGSRSYSLYLVHFLTLGMVGEVAARLLGIDKQAAGGSALWLGVTLVGVAAALTAAEILFRAVEAPSHRIARRLGRRDAPAMVLREEPGQEESSARTH